MPAKTAKTVPGPLVLEAMDPDTLIIGDNYRTDAADTITPAWTAQLAEHAKAAPWALDAGGQPHPTGNHTPVAVVTAADGARKLLFGSRRTLGCAAAKVWVLGYVAGAEDDSVAVRRARLIDQLTENSGRVATRRSDDARLIDALFDISGTTEAYVARAAGLKRPEVAAYRRIARSVLASKAVDKWEWLDLMQGAELDAFEDDQQAVGELVQAARNGQFDYTLSRLRDTRVERAERLAFEAEVTAAGYLVYGEDRRGVPVKMILGNLRTGDGEEIDPAEHAACDGAAVTIAYDWAWGPGQEQAYRDAHGLDDDDEIDFGPDGPEAEAAAEAAGWRPRWRIAEHLCNDPDAHGHVSVYGQRGEPAQQQAQAQEDKRAEVSAERRRVIARNKLWRAATDARRKHLAGWLAAPKLPRALEDAVTRYRAEAIARHETQPEMASFGHRTAAILLRLGGKGYESEKLLLAVIAAAAPQRVKVIELGMILGAGEHGCGGADGQDAQTWKAAETSWFSPTNGVLDRRVRYLMWIAEHTGYALSGIEQEIVDAGQPEARAKALAEARARAHPADVAPPPSEVDRGAGILSPAEEADFAGPATDEDGRVCILTAADGEDAGDHATHGHELPDAATHSYPGDPAGGETGVCGECDGPLPAGDPHAGLCADCSNEWDSKDSGRYHDARDAGLTDEQARAEVAAGRADDAEAEPYAAAEEQLDAYHEAAEDRRAGDDAESAIR